MWYGIIVVKTKLDDLERHSKAGWSENNWSYTENANTNFIRRIGLALSPNTTQSQQANFNAQSCKL